MNMSARNTLHPRIADHLAGLEATGGVAFPAAAEALGAWLRGGRARGESLVVVVVCTGNSRRSMLGAMMGNAAASYLGLPAVRFLSAGTSPSAFHARTIQALRAIGFEVAPTGDEAPRGPEGLANPRYLVRWGTNPDQRLVEYSKVLGDPALPREGFAAVMVCSQADAGCPIVPGARIRTSAPYPDPKSADGTAQEAERYALTRDALARLLLAALRKCI